MPPTPLTARDIAEVLVRHRLGQTSHQLAQRLRAPESSVMSRLLEMQAQGLVALQVGTWRWSGGALPPKKDQPLYGLGSEPNTLDLEAPGRWGIFRRLCRYYVDFVHREEYAEITLEAAPDSKDYRAVTLAPDWTAIECGREVPIVVPQVDAEFLDSAANREKAGPWLLCMAIEAVPIEGKVLLHPLVLVPVTVRISEGGALLVRSDGPVEVNRAWRRERRVDLDDDQELVVAVREAFDLGADAEAQSQMPLAASAVRTACKELAARRPTWIREPLLPDALRGGAPLHAVTRRGIYNRALLLRPCRLMFTAKLAGELRMLANPDRTTDEQLDRTALAAIFPHEPPPTAEDNATAAGGEVQIAELSLLNEEQRQAIRLASHAPLAVLTGPPGTGKSATVTHVMVDAARASRAVLMASRNHQALEAVEPRLNSIVHPDLAVFRPARPRDQVQATAQWQGAMTELLSRAAVPGSAERLSGAGRALEESLKQRMRAEEQMRRLLDLVEALARAEDHLAQRIRDVQTNPPSRLALAGLPDPAHGQAVLSAIAEAMKPVSWWRRPLRALAVVLLRILGRGPLSLAMLGATRLLESFRIAGCRFIGRSGLVGLVADLEEALRLAVAGEAARAADAVAREIAALRPRQLIERELDEAITKVHARTEEWLKAAAAAAGSGVSMDTRQRFANLRAAWASYSENQRQYRFELAMGRVHADLLEHFPLWAVSNLSARKASPLQPAAFDLLVLDEASQCDIPSVVPLLYRARRALIVGDPMQLGHITRMSQEEDQKLRRAHGLSDHLELERFSARANSMFALADSSAPLSAKVMLRAHYRCHPDIAGYCNSNFYRGKLRIMTSAYRAPMPGIPQDASGVAWVDVQGTVEAATTGCRSESEAEAVAAFVQRLVDAGFDRSLGVVAPFRAQADRIRELVATHLGGQQLDRMRFRVHTVDGFQGDERDVILFSLCAGPGMPVGSRNFLAREERRMNVAASRAKLHLRVFGNVDWVRSCGIPYIQALLAAAGQPAAAAGGRPDLIGPVWEPKLADAMREAGIEFHQQFLACGHHLDFALLLDGRKLAVEVDGETWHRDGDGLRIVDDLHRDRVLRDAGWKVVRFWVHQLREDMHGCVEEIRRAWLESPASVGS